MIRKRVFKKPVIIDCKKVFVVYDVVNKKGSTGTFTNKRLARVFERR